jgi:hypothetical protein
MKLQWKILIAFSIFLNCVFIAHQGVAYINDHLNGHPPPDRTSAFLRNYSPKHVIVLYHGDEYGMGFGETKGGWSLERGNFNEREIDAQFAIDLNNQFLFLTAVKDDIDAQLTRYGGTLLTQSGDLQEGFVINYRIGTTTGTVDLSPLAPLAPNSYFHRNSPLPDGVADVTFHVKIAEKTWN